MCRGKGYCPLDSCNIQQSPVVSLLNYSCVRCTSLGQNPSGCLTDVTTPALITCYSDLWLRGQHATLSTAFVANLSFYLPEQRAHNLVKKVSARPEERGTGKSAISKRCYYKTRLLSLLAAPPESCALGGPRGAGVPRPTAAAGTVPARGHSGCQTRSSAARPCQALRRRRPPFHACRPPAPARPTGLRERPRCLPAASSTPARPPPAATSTREEAGGEGAGPGHAEPSRAEPGVAGHGMVRPPARPPLGIPTTGRRT